MNYDTETIIVEAEKSLSSAFEKINETAIFNQKKVLDAFRNHCVAARHFYGTTGYGYDDVGRDTLNKIYAEVFGCEAAIVSPYISSGTQALTVALFGVLRTGHKAVSLTGEPYDTLNKVIFGRDNGSLADFGIGFDIIAMDNGVIDERAVEKYLSENSPELVYIQRSRGYTSRNALTVADIGKAVDIVKRFSPGSVIMVDNCYGEFIEKTEPSSAGADIIVGSLIKNPGGGLAPCGGYIAGRADLIEKVGYRLTAPSLGTEVGSYEAGYRPFYQGLFMAPHVTAQAVKGMLLFSESMKSVGFATLPDKSDPIGDIICSVRFDTKEQLIAFCQGIQYVSPVDSFAVPEPWDMPGYLHQVIMAAGCFVGGSSIELSCDSPIKEPYIAYLQGGLTYEHVRIAVKECLDCLKRL